jgi:DNA (cytosine-5)-methyltransferase 1
MSTRAYYNEIDPYAAQWLRNLIAAGHIAPGDVDERDIRDVRPIDLTGYTQCHFFAGIGVWSHALRRAGWSDSRPVWTGSCPCQPFSVAGVGGGFNDERHLWPFFFDLIEQCRPGVVLGEQVASKDGLAWLDLVQSDLEGAGYAAAAVDLCAAGVGAPHIRQRLWFVAHADGLAGGQGRALDAGRDHGSYAQQGAGLGCSCLSCLVGDTDHSGLEGLGGGHQAEGGWLGTARPVAAPSELGDAGPVNGYWRAADWIACRDNKWRAVEPGASPLAHGAAARVGRLRAYGNAINAEAAVEVIGAAMGVLP